MSDFKNELDEILFIKDVVEKIKMGTKNLWALSYAGEFGMGTIGTSTFVNKKEFLKYIERNHFVARENLDSEPAVVDGKISTELTYYNESISELPMLYTIKEFTEIMNKEFQMDITKRTIMRYCEYGFFPHFRIGRGYRLSKNDILVGIDVLKNSKSIRLALREKRNRLKK